MKVTADTITDEQIRELRESLYGEGYGDTEEACEAIVYCRIALGGEAQRNARARCAAILNARNGADS